MQETEENKQEVYTVSQLTAETRFILEDHFASIYLIGEISNLAKPSSGHYYFLLKDSQAQIRCAMFRNAQRQLSFTPESGQQVLVQAKVSLYEPRGEFQLIVLNMQLAGEGALQLAFEQLKQKLSEEGLFDDAHKLEIPEIPSCIGVITSPTGAAIRDILHVLNRRFPAAPVIIYPSAVQGSEAKNQLVRAIEKANQRKECDVLLLARGGGSLEDLWPFNEENVARAIYASKIPIVTGVGHEIDFTIADFVADQRCPTPSAAAEWVSPDIEEWKITLKDYFRQISQLTLNQLKHYQRELIHYQKRLQHPGQRIQQQMQTFDQLEQRFAQAIKTILTRQQQRLQSLSRQLDTVSPLNTLKRGYAIVTHKEHVITENKQVNKGDQLNIQLSDGTLNCIVTD